MRKLIILSAVFLTACVSVPVERKFPSVPDQLMVSCPPLKTVDPSTTQLSQVVDSVVTNYGLYQECDNKMDTWIEWYRTQKQIFDSVK
jgi:hypothetical protein